ncbi:MAG: RNA-binding S4 domain-containing protein [Bacteroidales bacterium]|nr:RNA-binding S4 domain-containing protein [Bacteroidales bacterium]
MKFELNQQEYIELMKLLKFLGLVESGTEAKLVIDNGEVRVNGQTELRRRCKIRSGDKVEFGGEVIEVD